MKAGISAHMHEQDVAKRSTFDRAPCVRCVHSENGAGYASEGVTIVARGPLGPPSSSYSTLCPSYS